jgi:hypothetical protein
MKKWYTELIFKENDVKVKDGLTSLLDNFESFELFLKHFIENCIFFKKEHIEKQEIRFKEMLKNNEKFTVRFSTKSEKHFYFKSENSRGFSVKNFKNKAEGLKFCETNDLFYEMEDGREIPITFDKDGNYEVRNQIKNYTGIVVSQGTKISTHTNYTISHIWENTTINPLRFTALWNIVLVPSYISFVLDKSDDHSELARKIKLIFRGLCLSYYSPEDLTKKEKDELNMAVVYASKTKQLKYELQFA